MEIRRNKKGEIISYKEKAYVNGKTITKTFKRKTDADKWKMKIETEKQQGSLCVRPYIKFDEFIEIWRKHRLAVQPSLRTVESHEGCLRLYILPLFGSFKLKDITVAQGYSLITFLKEKGLGPTRINFVLTFFKQVLNDAVRWDYLLKNPLINVKPPRKSEAKTEYWLTHEIHQFLEANKDDFLFPVYLLALNTGLRRGEILGLCWDKINFSTRQILVSRTLDRTGLKETTKTHVSRFVPMNDAVFNLLKGLEANKKHFAYIFTMPDGNLIDPMHMSDRYFARAIKKAGVRKIRFHDLRHTYASNYCMSGGDVFALSKILGHASVEMTASRYAHLHPSFMAKMAQTVNFELSVEQKNTDSPYLAPRKLELVVS